MAGLLSAADGASRRPRRVVIVDDSRSMRALIAHVLSADPRLEVVGEAADPYEAREVIKRTAPDVITLDVEMPRMDGLSFLKRLMRLRPMPVVMLSNETQSGSRAAIEALALGAIDVVGKPQSMGPEALADLASRVFTAACARVAPGPAARADEEGVAGFDWNERGVLIGASTGGVDALERVLRRLPAAGPPVMIAQHMPASFLESFASRLEDRVRPRVRLAEPGAPILPGTVHLAPGGAAHLQVDGPPGRGRCRLVEGPKRSGHRPSVDVLFSSAEPWAEHYVAVLLTGMGRDGAAGMAALRAQGAYTIAQDRASSVVYGMPRVAEEMGAVVEICPLDEIGDAILRACHRGGAGTRTAVPELPGARER